MSHDAKKTIKRVVWDLDNTLWNGILLEDSGVTVRDDVARVLRTLDERGILHSIASRNDHDAYPAPCTSSSRAGARRTCPSPRPCTSSPTHSFWFACAASAASPDMVFEEAELMARFLPVLRADIALNESTPYVDESPLACPITAIGGSTDENAQGEELDAWQIHTAAEFSRETFPGGHFFIQTARAPFLAALSRRLQAMTAAR